MGVFEFPRRKIMFTSKRRVAEVASEAIENVSPYVDQFARDERFRRRLIAAIGAAAAAQRRARRQAGWVGLATRLSSDPVLRAQLAQAVEQLQKAKSRKSRRKHTMRNATLILGGVTVAVAAVPDLRDPMISRARRLYRRAWDSSGTPTTATIVEDIEVAAPVSVVYNQWTQFEEFPTFMEGIDEVKQLDDTLIHWAASIAGKKAEWDAKIIQQEPDKRITWESIDGMNTRGTVSFEQAGSTERTLIRLRMTYRADGAADVIGSAIGLDELRVRGDLERFRDLIEERKSATGAWRGTIEDGTATTTNSTSGLKSQKPEPVKKKSSSDS
jgi:uncharacterized membrane protein